MFSKKVSLGNTFYSLFNCEKVSESLLGSLNGQVGEHHCELNARQ